MVSTKSRVIRVIIGLTLIVGIWYFYRSWWALIGLIPLVVGVTGFCPACYFLNRCSIKRR
ncbi:YgaP family membrane protein [Campylobacter blaseri]|uniref:Thiol:disulfide interchange protein n=1 Tax=Campylobacter blaseri TaxID=2042961 RepID=A0A2P8R145_9BACT|nr:DUF2892 domain-containing protein [Campylobacter blaseri]PSM52216.1 thiol:disulfide interchange protein [Campylobacter blaseri]PSM53982.1 thiol:disulfide interchange protein [Campylobacter blaseri]